MRKYTILFTLIFFFIIQTVFAEQRVESFRALIAINPDASITVKERIVYDFDLDKRHGIFRDIPYKYKTRFGSYKAEITDISVTDEAGNPRRFSTSRGDGNIQIKIGDPDKYVEGVRTYDISYTVHDVISYYKTYNELYWNVTGDNWQVNIETSGGIVSLPVGGDGNILTSACYNGPRGSNRLCGGAEVQKAEGNLPERYAFLGGALSSGEGLTVAVSFPKGLVYEPSLIDGIYKFASDNWVVLIPVIIFSILMRLWYLRGRDPKGQGTIIPRYKAPKNMTPAELGAIYDEVVSAKEVSSEIIHLAVNGYIKIHQIEKKLLILTTTDYFLEKLKEYDDLDRKYDRKIMRALFAGSNISARHIGGELIKGVLLSSLDKTFYKDFKEIEKQIYVSVTQKGYFVKNPQTVRYTYNMYFTFGIILFIFSTFLIIIVADTLSFDFGINPLLTGVSLALSGIIIFVFGFLMPKRTKKGVLAREHISGLKDYIGTVESERIKFHNSPKHTPEEFDILLPFAMALSQERGWAKKFQDIYKSPPSWYSGTYGSFNINTFSSDLTGFVSAAQSNLSSAPSSSGSGVGGFSGGAGGGFGGGGGGSW